MCVDIQGNKGSRTKNSSEALNQLTSLRIVIVLFNMEREAMRAQIDSWGALAISPHLTVAVDALFWGYCDVDLTILSPEKFWNGGSDAIP